MHDSMPDTRVTDPSLDSGRRRLLGGFVGGTLAGLVGWQATEADRKRRSARHAKHRKRRRDRGGDRRRTAAESKQEGNAAALKVMTRNLYLGANLQPIFEVAPRDLLGAVGKVFAMVHATNFPERAKALADEIAAASPLLVGLQEVTTWRTGTPVPLSDWRPGMPTPTPTTAYDYLAILLGELAARGQDYRVAAEVTNTEAQAPGLISPELVQDIRLRDRDVILARADLPQHVFAVGNAASSNFAAWRTIQLGGTEIRILRGWAEVDVRLHGETIRIVSTHLEPDDPVAHERQATELVSGPLSNRSLPTVLLGDLNSPAPDGSTYNAMLDAGFADAWTTARPNDAGFTWGHDADLRNPEPALSQRIDLVLSRGGMTASSANRVGHEPDDRTPSGLWPSDHAGVWAVLRVKDA